MARDRVRIPYASGLVILAALIGAGQALAQTPPPAPSQVTPRVLRPEALPAPPPTIDLPSGASAQAPPGAETLSVTVAQITAEGGFEDMSAETRRILTPLEQRRATVAELYAAASALEQAYARAGYFLARVAVPQQQITDGGTFRLVVIDGYFDEVDVTAVPPQILRPVRAAMRGLEGRRRLKLTDLQARLNLAQTVPGSRIRSTIAQGQAPGAARLVLDGGFDRWSASISSDNRLGRSFDHWGLNLQATVNSPTGSGEQAYLFLSGSPRRDTFRNNALRRVVGGGVIVPLTSDGLKINPEFTLSDTHPIPANPLLASHGLLKRGAVTLSSPLALPYAAPGSTTGRLTFEMADERQSLPFFGVITSRDRLAVARGNLAWSGALLGAPLRVDATVSQGLKVFGHGDKTAADPTSRESDPLFTKLELQVDANHRLPLGLDLLTTLRGQYAGNFVLPNSETFDLTGQSALSSFPPAALNADAGATARLQLEKQMQHSWNGLRLSETPYLLVSAGWASLNLPSPQSPTSGIAYGAGLRLQLSGLPFDVSPTLAFQYGRGEPNRGVPPEDRLQIALGVSF